MPRILIIEDEANIRANLRRYFQLEGHEVIEADNGLSGLEAAQLRDPDVIVCDVMLPGLDGFGILQALRASGGARVVPFFFLSAAAETERRQQGIALGATGYLVKPFSLSDLGVVIAALNNGPAAAG